MEKREIIAKLNNLILEIQDEPVFNKFIDLTESVFSKLNPTQRAILIISYADFNKIKDYLLYAEYDNCLIKNVTSPHGIFDYVILQHKGEMRIYAPQK